MKVHPADLRPCDLIFASRSDDRISHMAMVVSRNSVFHCTYPRGVVVDSVDFFLHDYVFPFQTIPELIGVRDKRHYKWERKKELGQS